jgi:hypothetical protein
LSLYAPRVLAVPLTFEAGVFCASAFKAGAKSLPMWVGVLMPGALTLAASGFCFRQARRGESGLRSNGAYNMIMLSAGALLLIFGVIFTVGGIVFLAS